MDTVLYSDQYKLDWDQFVLSRPDCNLYHHVGWKEVIEKSYDHKCFYLMARDHSDLKGILPLVWIKSRIFGSSLTSLPFLDSAGIVADDSQTSQSLLQEAVRLCHAHDIDYLELRQFKALEHPLETDTRKVCLTLDLKSDSESMWNSLSSERRNRIKKATKSGLQVQFGDREMLPRFYEIWIQNMRALGSPPHSIRFFDNILRVFAPFSKIIMVKYHNTNIGGALCLFFKHRFTVPWVSSLRQYFDLYPNNILYWEAMKFAMKEGCKIFDFGRSTVGSGTYAFKVRWGAKEEQLFWQFRTHKRSGLTVPSIENPRYRLASRVWSKLPITMTRLIGPNIRKYITA